MSFKAFLLTLFILACGVFIYIKVETLGPDTSSFNQTTRYKLGRHPLLRTLFSLHKDGDARAEYLVGDTPIVLEFAHAQSSGLGADVVNKFAQQIKQYTGREVQVFDEDSFKGGTLTDDDLADIVKSDRRHVLPAQPNLFVMVTQDFQGPDDQIARTYDEYGIVISMQKLQKLVDGYSGALVPYEQSTLLHEFGHQIGLDHNTVSGCVMNAIVESPVPAGPFSANSTPTAFCNTELQQLDNIKKSLRGS